MTTKSLSKRLFRQIDKYTLYDGKRDIHKKIIKDIVSQCKTRYPTQNFNYILRRNSEFGPDFTPLHLAIIRTSSPILELLINEGADPSIKIYNSYFSKDGITAYELCNICKFFNRKKIIKLIEPYTIMYNIKNNFYNIITHCNVIKSISICKYTESIYLKIHNKIKLLFLIRNKMPVYLPNELWFKILEMNYIKNYLN